MDYYEITVQGHLDARRAESFEGLELKLLPGGGTLIAGPLRDQAELHAMLRQIRDMGIPLVSVKLMNDDGGRPAGSTVSRGADRRQYEMKGTKGATSMQAGKCSTETPRILLLGYNGATNTGAEALLQTDIRDLRALMPEATITVPTLNEANLRRYIREDSHLRIVPLPTLYFHAIDRLVSRNDMVILVEGSTYMDTWGSALLWAFVWGTACARRRNKPCLAFAVDAGRLKPFNQRLLGRVSCQPHAVITRNRPAADRLRSWGFLAQIDVTADNAFRYQPNLEDQGWYLKDWPEARDGVIGLAVVDFSLWPVVMRPWGSKEHCYRWPYYFSQSAARTRQSEELADGFAALADHITETYGRQVALICMEQVDESLARRIHGRMRHGERARVFSAREYDASRMTVLLRSLDYLVTSRYHAAVLSLPAQIPQVAVGHDYRLADLHGELGFGNEFFVTPHSGEMFLEIRERLAALAADQQRVADTLHQAFQEHLARAERNRGLLRDFLVAQGWSVRT